MSDVMTAFRDARDRIQAQRDRYRNTDRMRQDRPHTWQGVDLEGVAEDIARDLYDRLCYDGTAWVLLSNGARIPAGVVISAVRDRLPADIVGERRESLAQVLVAGVTFREFMRR